jgi:hypothetical protein
VIGLFEGAAGGLKVEVRFPEQPPA